MQRVTTIAGMMCCAALTFALTSSAAAPDEATVRELEAKCEEAREAKLKPLREIEVARCKTERRNDPEYCERYWRDLGNASRRPDGRMTPRKFDDLAECVAAREARHEYDKNK